MAALGKDRVTLRRELGLLDFPIGAGMKIYAHSMAALNSNGFLCPAQDAVGYQVVGMSREQYDNTLGADGAIRGEVYSPKNCKFLATSITQAMVGQAMYVVDDQTFDDQPGANGVFAGILVDCVSATEGWLLIGANTSAILVDVTASAAELNVMDGATPGAAVASKAVVLGAASEISGMRLKVNLAAATQTLTAAQSGEKFVGAVDAVFTLPAAAAGTKGVWYSFETGALSVGVGLSISPAAADHIRGNGLTSVDNKDLSNTGATDRLGDGVRLYCDGVDGWVIEGNPVGIWAKEP